MNDDEAVREFVRRHAKPYDPETDTYDRQAFATDIKEGKNDPIYNAHSYHTKVPPRAIIPYILHYTEPGDLILDPFCGSGMTGVAALMCANPPGDILEQFPDLKDRLGPRHAILNDLSPAACHIAYNYTTPVDVEALKAEFERIKAAVKDEFDWLYGTEHYAPAVGLYDPANPEVAGRLKNPPDGASTNGRLIDGGPKRTWELIDREDVERRLGYCVSDLPREQDWSDLDVASVTQWLVIPATIQYTIWSDVYRCEGLVTVEEPTDKVSTRGKNAGKRIVRKTRSARGCNREFTLWETAFDPATGAVSDRFKCPHCPCTWRKMELHRTGSQAVTVNYSFDAIPQGGRRKRVRCRRPPTARELSKIREISEREGDYWCPSTVMDPTGPQYRRSALNVRDVRRVTDFWTPRNRRALSLLWFQASQAPDERLRRASQFLLTSFAARVSRKAEYRTAGGAGNTHKLTIPSIVREDNLLKACVEKERDVLQYFIHLARLRCGECTIVINGSATDLRVVPSESVDYLFADPPFGSNIYYSEPNLLWEAWLGRITDIRYEAVVHRKNDGGTKRLKDYAALMQTAFAEAFRVLKPGRWCTVEFNNSDGAVFEVIKLAIRDAGFDIANMLLFDKAQKTFKQLKGASGEEDVVDKDVVFNLRKPSVVSTRPSSLDPDLEVAIVETVRAHLQVLPARIEQEPQRYTDEHRTTATLNSVLMNALIPRGVAVERLNLPLIERVCARYFRKIGQRWYLRGEAIGAANGGLLGHEELVIKDEETAIGWIRQQVERAPALLGELKPLWMRATGLLSPEVSQRLILEELLSENFWRDLDTNRWREPTPEERERMNDDRSIRVLHDAERFAKGTLERPTSDAERCEWIDVLFNACKAVEEKDQAAVPALRGFDVQEAYRAITRVFTSVLREHVDASIYRAAAKQAAVAGSRMNRLADDGKAEASRGGEKREGRNGALPFDEGNGA